MAAQKRKIQKNISAKNAERAYKILDEMKYEDKSLYDIVFDQKPLNILSKMTNEERAEFIKLSKENDKPGADRDKFAMTIAEKFPSILTPATESDFVIKKALRLNAELTHELSELFTGTKPQDIMEAVENALLYIGFLGGM